MNRTIRQRTRGQPRGAFARMVSRGDLGQRLKPFDFIDADIAPGFGFDLHPHSGIAWFVGVASSGCKRAAACGTAAA